MFLQTSELCTISCHTRPRAWDAECCDYEHCAWFATDVLRYKKPVVFCPDSNPETWKRRIKELRNNVGPVRRCNCVPPFPSCQRPRFYLVHVPSSFIRTIILTPTMPFGAHCNLNANFLLIPWNRSWYCCIYVILKSNGQFNNNFHNYERRYEIIYSSRSFLYCLIHITPYRKGHWSVSRDCFSYSSRRHFIAF